MSGCIKLLLISILIFSTTLLSAQTVFSENVGTPAGTTAIASHTFQNTPALTFSGTADVRNTTVSSGYVGASGGGNVFFTNTVGRDFIISNINTTGYSALTLEFGHYKSTTAANNELVVETSPDGVTYTPLTYTRPTGAGTSTWLLVTASGTIPATANLRIRFRQTSSTIQFRLDDIRLYGTVSCTPAAAPTTLATAFNSTTFCTSAQINFTAGNGAKRIAVVSTTNFADTPVNGTAYSSNTTFGSGATVGAGNFVVMNGTGNSVTITGLTANTTYYIKVFEYNGVTSNCDESYLTAVVTSYSFTTQNNCSTPQIRSILVDACTSQEGLDELVIIENGANALNINDITINFPSGGSFCNSGCGTNTLLNNPAYITQLNTQAGCTLFAYADPIPANAIIVVFTGLTPSYVFDYSSQCPSSSTYYAIFCNNASTAGRFANSGTGTRTLDINFTSSSDVVTYDLGSTLGDGTFVDFDTPGNPTYRQEINCIYPLGVNWGNFTAQKAKESVELNWETLSEINADYFAIEQAGENLQFQQIGTVECIGNTEQRSLYQFTDRSPKNGMNYYRLRQFDTDGKWNYSTIAAINFRSDLLSAAYFSEAQQLVFSQTFDTESTAEVYAGNGQLIVNTTLEENQQMIPCQLSTGIHLVKVIDQKGNVQLLRFFAE